MNVEVPVQYNTVLLSLSKLISYSPPKDRVTSVAVAGEAPGALTGYPVLDSLVMNQIYTCLQRASCLHLDASCQESYHVFSAED
jgi:hypothetical protein